MPQPKETSTKYRCGSRMLCRFNLPKIDLLLVDPKTTHEEDQKNNDDANENDATTVCTTTVSLKDLEEALDQGLDHLDDIDDDDDDNSRSSNDSKAKAPPIEYKLKADVVWTNARRPYRPLDSFLGLLEDFPDEEAALECTCLVRSFVATSKQPDASASTATSTSGCCNCPFPHEPWSQSSSRLSTTEKNHANNGTFANDSSITYSQQDNACTAKRKIIDWIDLTRLDGQGDALFPTPRSAMHMLRSLLGIDQCVSPWVHLNSNDNSNVKDENASAEAATTATAPISHQADVVIVALDPQQLRHEHDALRSFRVSDASPAWALHAIVPSWKKLDQSNEDHDDSIVLPLPAGRSDQCCSSLMIYKRLPPRDCLQRYHPITKEPCPVEECLWETVRPAKKNGDERASEKEGNAPKSPEWTHRLVSPPYLDPKVHYPNIIEVLQSHLPIIQKEAQGIAHWTAWPEQQHYQATSSDPNAGAPWNVFPLCYCFPANQVEQRKWIELTAAAVPGTTRALQCLGDTLRTALFSRLDPGAVLEAHTGWQDLANHVVRLHVPLDIPAEGHLCGTWVDGCVMTHLPVTSTSTDTTESMPPFVCFDDSKIHRAFNYSTKSRTVLILDLARPPHWPLGTATGGHSDELDAFIQQMSSPR